MTEINLEAQFEAMQMLRESPATKGWSRLDSLLLRDDLAAIMAEDGVGPGTARRLLTQRIGGLEHLRSYLESLHAGAEKGAA